jgi:hypothetical protein
MNEFGVELRLPSWNPQIDMEQRALYKIKIKKDKNHQYQLTSHLPPCPQNPPFTCTYLTTLDINNSRGVIQLLRFEFTL